MRPHHRLQQPDMGQNADHIDHIYYTPYCILMDKQTDAFETKRQALISRLKRVEGQLRGIQGMISSDEDCERVAQQLSAARKALDKAFFEAMRCAMERELLDDDASPDVLNSRLEHMTALIAKYG